METRNILVLLVAGLLVLSACSGGSGPSAPREVFQPNWYGIQENPEYVFTYGQATRVSQNAAETAAYANAMQEAAQYVEAHVQGMVQNFMEESGFDNPQVLQMTSQVTRVVADAQFSGTSVSERSSYVLDNGRYQAFVRVSIPKEEINRNLTDQIRNEEALYNQFRASQSFQELDRQLESR